MKRAVDAAVKAAERATLPLFRMIRRGVLKTVTDTLFAQVEQFTDELVPDVEMWQDFGFTSRPPAETEVLTVHPYGAAEGAIAIATNNRTHRPALAQGDAAIYGETTGGGDQAIVKTRQDGQIQCLPAAGLFVEVGGDAELLLLGETVKANLKTFADAVVAMGVTGTAVQNAAALEKIRTAATNLSSATSAWLATKGKVT